jgi:hypothetical protein
LRASKLEHAGAELLIDEIVVLELANRFFDPIASEQIIENFRFADINHGHDFDVVPL